MSAIGHTCHIDPGQIYTMIRRHELHQRAEKPHIVNILQVCRIVGTGPAIVPMLLVAIRVHGNKALPLGQHIKTVKGGVGTHTFAIPARSVQQQQQSRFFGFRRRHIGAPAAPQVIVQ